MDNDKLLPQPSAIILEAVSYTHLDVYKRQVQVWADAAGARAGTARSVQRGQRYPMVVTDYKRKGRTVATLVVVSRLAHAWSGGDANKAFSDGKGPDASRMVWTFAARQFRA